MTFPTIPTAGANTLLTSSQSTATTTHTFPSLTTLAQSAGDLMIAVIVTYQGSTTNAEFSSWGGGFTEFVDQSANSTTVQSIGAAYKFADGTETGTFTVTSATSNRSVMFLMTIPGAHSSTVPEATAKANGTTAAADPAALDPTNWGTEDTLWVAVGVNGETSLTGSFTGITAAPTNYTSYLDSGIIGGDVIGALEGAVAFRQNTTGSEDAGGFTLDVGAAGNSALLIAVRPAPTPADTVGFDAVGPSSAGAGGASPTSPLTWSHTCTGTNQLLVVGVAMGHGSGTPTVTATYNSVSMTQVGTVQSDQSTTGDAWLFALVNPTTGTNTVSVSWSGGGAADAIEAGSISFINVEQSSVANAVTNVTTLSSTGQQANPSIDVTSATKNMVVDILVMGGSITSSADQQRWLKNVNSTTAGGNGAQATQAGASTVTMNYTAGAESWGMIGANIQAFTPITLPTLVMAPPRN